MDNETITARQIGYTYMINSSTFAKRYKDTLSDFETWEQKGHASEWILLPLSSKPTIFPSVDPGMVMGKERFL